MTTLDPFNEISSDLSYEMARLYARRPAFPAMAVLHFCIAAGVAVVCYLLVHH